MLKKLKQVSIIAGLMLMIGLTACSPEQIAAFNRLSPEGKAAVAAHYRQQNQAPIDCNQAIDRYFSGDKNRMKQIVWRESRNQPTAANPRSSARGCAQLLIRTHGHRFTAVGCSPDQWGNAACNIKAADHLYRQAGWSPWNF